MSTLRVKGAGMTDVRRWARQNGFSVADRGAIPAEAMEAYKRALRTWAVTHGLAGQVGRISAGVIEQFNEQNIKAESAESNGHPKKTKSNSSKQDVSRRPRASEVRAAARSAGYEISDRGRIPNKILQDFVSNKI